MLTDTEPGEKPPANPNDTPEKILQRIEQIEYLMSGRVREIAYEIGAEIDEEEYRRSSEAVITAAYLEVRDRALALNANLPLEPNLAIGVKQVREWCETSRGEGSRPAKVVVDESLLKQVEFALVSRLSTGEVSKLAGEGVPMTLEEARKRKVDKRKGKPRDDAPTIPAKPTNPEIIGYQCIGRGKHRQRDNEKCHKCGSAVTAIIKGQV